MAKNNFLLLSMEDDQINKVANVVSNKSSKKILDLLSEKEYTESEISKELSLPISTAHYNLQQLMDAGLVTADEYHYSKKGREVLHYKLANKYIIIAPQKKKGLKSILKNILPVTLITGGIAMAIELSNRFFFNTTNQMLGAGTWLADDVANSGAMMTKSVATDGIQDTAAYTAPRVLEESAAQATNVAPMMQEIIPPDMIMQNSEPNIALWFFFGALTAVLIFALISLFKKK